MADRILMTPQELRDAKTTLDSLNNDIQGSIRTLETTLTNLEAYWEGASRSAFMNSYQENFHTMLTVDFPQVITGLGSQLEAAANAIEQADDAVAASIGA